MVPDGGADRPVEALVLEVEGEVVGMHRRHPLRQTLPGSPAAEAAQHLVRDVGRHDVTVRELLGQQQGVEARAAARVEDLLVARELGVPKATASRWLGQLEQRVGQPLFKRGARRLLLTERGTAIVDQLPPLQRALRALRAAALEDTPGGTVRVSVPVPFGRLIGGAVIARFGRQLPRVRLEVVLQNARVDLLRERFDLAIRGGPMPDSDLVARRLATLGMWLYCSPRYREAALADIPFIAAPGDEARFQESRPELLPAAVLVDDRSAVCDALVAGAGAGVLPATLGEPHRAEGRLWRLVDAPVAEVAVHAVFLPEQRGDARLRILLEIIREEMAAWRL